MHLTHRNAEITICENYHDVIVLLKRRRFNSLFNKGHALQKVCKDEVQVRSTISILKEKTDKQRNKNSHTQKKRYIQITCIFAYI